MSSRFTNCVVARASAQANCAYLIKYGYYGGGNELRRNDDFVPLETSSSTASTPIGAGATSFSWPASPSSTSSAFPSTVVANSAVCMGMADVAVALILVVLIFTTIVGNVLVVLSVAVYRRMRTFTNVLLVSLSSADLLVGVLVMPLSLIDQLHRHRWQFDLILCKLWTTVDVLLCTASILNLVSISLDRYFAITSPLRYTRTRSQKLAAAIVTAVWILSLVISSPPWFVPEWRIQLADETCGYAKATPYRIYSALGSFYIPLLIMLFVYFKIFRVASSREKLLNVDRRGSRTMQMWHQQASRRAQRNVPDRHAIGTGTTRSHGSAAGAHAPRMQQQMQQQYDVMQPLDEQSDDDEDVVVQLDGGRQKRSISVGGNNYCNTGNNSNHTRCDSPSPSLQNMNCVSVGSQYRQQLIRGSRHRNPNQPRARRRLRFQRMSTDEAAEDWKGGDCNNDLVPGGTAESVSDLTTIGRPTIGISRTSLVDGPDATTGNPVNAPSTTTTNVVPVLSEHAKRYFERTVPWSLVSKANEYYVNSKPLRPSREKLMYLKERKALKTIGIVVSGFIICWLPFFILYLIEAACFFYTNGPNGPLGKQQSSSLTMLNASSENQQRPTVGYYASRAIRNFSAFTASVTSHARAGRATTQTVLNMTSQASSEEHDLPGCSIPPFLADIFLWLGYSNSVLNPLIYTFYNRDFRRCFKDLLSGGCLKRNAANRRMSVRRLHQTRL